VGMGTGDPYLAAASRSLRCASRVDNMHPEAVYALREAGVTPGGASDPI
jgi:hypothetical protein